MLRALLEAPERWGKIFTLSRTPPTGIDSPRVQHIAIDLLSGVDNIKAALSRSNVKADYAFFFAYKEVSGKNDSRTLGWAKRNGRLERPDAEGFHPCLW